MVGTSGFSFPDWKGVFYPENIKQADFLTYYTGFFPTVEINSTYYAVPRVSVFENMTARTPENFKFIVKTNKATTHDHDDKSVNESFIEAVAPLKESGKLDGILAQFPWGFRNTEKNRNYLCELKETYNEFPFFTEFRHKSWDDSGIYDFLRSKGILFVSVDEPQIGNMMPPKASSTGDTAYIRFHGRNSDTWWNTSGDRYDYNYNSEELGEWIEKIEVLEKTVWKIYAFFNNCHKGYAVRNAMMFKDMLEKKGLL